MKSTLLQNMSTIAFIHADHYKPTIQETMASIATCPKTIRHYDTLAERYNKTTQLVIGIMWNAETTFIQIFRQWSKYRAYQDTVIYLAPELASIKYYREQCARKLFIEENVDLCKNIELKIRQYFFLHF